jgi:hypothetical protein
MKKLLSLALALVMVLSLVACGAGTAEGGNAGGDEAGASAALQVGYGKANITPEKPVPMGGYGRSDKRISQGILNYLYATCIAITDADDNTILLFGMDITAPGEAYVNFGEVVSKATGVPLENIVISASHTHSAPDYGAGDVAGVGDALQLLKNGMVKAAETAMKDRKPAEMATASVETERMNFVRHYLMNDGSYCGSNFGDASSGYKEHSSEADPILQLVKFTREGEKDIILTNFQCHPHQTGGSNRFELASDVVGEYRTEMEKDKVNVIYFSGAGGNINSSSFIKELNATKDFHEWGVKMAEYARSAQYTPVSGGKVQVKKTTYEGKVNHEMDAYAASCGQLRSQWDQGKLTTAQVIEAGKELGIELHSPYHAGAISNRAGMGRTESFDVWTYSFGDIGFVAAPYEMFDNNGQYIKENSPFSMTVVATLCNRANGYIPSEDIYQYGSYECDTTKFVKGTGEELAELFVSMLTELHNSK